MKNEAIFNNHPENKPEALHYGAAMENACKLCSPLGACMVFKGIENCVPLIHGGQGCATYIRRYLISHFREPVDIASSNFSEESTIFGGSKIFNLSIDNIQKVYHPEIIGICSTCLSETIGENIPMLINNYRRISQSQNTILVSASTPSYAGTHAEGFHEAVFAVVKALADNNAEFHGINLFPGMLSPADLRHLKEILCDFKLNSIMLPDYSETFDNPVWKTYKRIPEGGTPVNNIRKTGSSGASIEFGTMLNKGWGLTKTNKSVVQSAGEYLEKYFHVPNVQIPIPIGISLTDAFFNQLKQISSGEIPGKYSKSRGRLIDSYIDAHKIVFEKRAIVYGEEDLVVSMVAFLSEVGIRTVLASSGADGYNLKTEIEKVTDNTSGLTISGNTGFEHIRKAAGELKPDIIIGNSRGYYISRELDIPFVRIGFPIHDRIGSQRIMHIGYQGTQQLFDRIANALLEHKQDKSPVGYKYM
ncbi:MAG: nitrogenase component 1 [Bacteroidales bacterium]